MTLMFHQDFIAGTLLATKIRNFGFFAYELHEALHLSEQEEAKIKDLFASIEAEYQSSIDHFSHEVMITHVELLLQYSSRFYARQFITRKVANDEILIRLEGVLNGLLESQKGLPTVQQVARELNVSADYLSDMLRTVSGQTAQQHIQARVIEKAKQLLATTNLQVSEIAYQMGFEYPQSFHKLFKNKTNMSPLQYRESLN
jgi:AraC-like DNA-binding protein